MSTSLAPPPMTPTLFDSRLMDRYSIESADHKPGQYLIILGSFMEDSPSSCSFYSSMV